MAPQVPGVVDVTVNLIMEQATVKYRPSMVGPRDLLERVEHAGFEASLARGGAADRQADASGGAAAGAAARAWRGRFALSAVLSVPLAALAMLVMVPPLMFIEMHYKVRTLVALARWEWRGPGGRGRGRGRGLDRGQPAAGRASEHAAVPLHTRGGLRRAEAAAVLALLARCGGQVAGRAA
jgi:hypothetical protein